MPCRGPDTDYGAEAAAYKAEIDKLTRLLCHACSAHTYPFDGLFWNKDLSEWWVEHQKLDAARAKAKKEAEDFKVRHDAYLSDLHKLQKKHGM